MERGPAQTQSGAVEARAKKGAEARSQSVQGLDFPRYFTLPGVDPFDEIEWEVRSAVIGNEKGKVGFEQRDVEIPSFWSQQATNIVVSKYFRELLAGGGTASGPVSFMKGYDAFAGVIKSGGKTRRAAKMVILNADHPDVEEFINCKVEEEKKAWALIDAGYDGSFTGVAYGSIFFQNSNNSVRVTDDFMRAVLDDDDRQTHAVTDRRVMDTHNARDLMLQIAKV